MRGVAIAGLGGKLEERLGGVGVAAVGEEFAVIGRGVADSRPGLALHPTVTKTANNISLVLTVIVFVAWKPTCGNFRQYFRLEPSLVNPSHPFIRAVPRALRGSGEAKGHALQNSARIPGANPRKIRSMNTPCSRGQRNEAQKTHHRFEREQQRESLTTATHQRRRRFDRPG